MSSNMIKAYSIAYDTNKIKNLDMEDRENDLLERARMLISAKETQDGAQAESGFVPGLIAEDLGELEVQEIQDINELREEPAPVVTEQMIEEIKNSLREEIMAEMTPILNRRGEDIIANARAQASALVEAAKRDGEIAKEGILKMASAQGYEEGSKRAKQEEEKALALVEERRMQLEQEYAAKIAELEPAFAEILIELVKKVTNVAYENHKEVLLYLIETGLGLAQKDTGFDVLLNEEDYKKYESLFPKIKEAYKEKYALEFRKDAALPEGSCKLENENRVIDCGLGIRLNGLLDGLSLLGR